MNIILNEIEWAEDAIANKSLGNKPYNTLTRVARYYFHLGYTEGEVRKLVKEFLLRCDDTASLPKWAKLIGLAVTKAKKYSIIQMDGIDVTEDEIEMIKSLPGRQAPRLMFTLICVSKYWDAISPSNHHWVNCKDNDIMRMANINTSLKRQGLIYNRLREAGLITFSKRIDNTNIRVKFVGTGKPALHISDFRNLGNQYLKYKGEPFFECQCCGLTLKCKNRREKGRRPKYCTDCAAQIKMRQSVESVMRSRKKE